VRFRKFVTSVIRAKLTPSADFVVLLMLEQREDLSPFPVRDKPCGGERPARGVHLQQEEVGEQPPILVPSEKPCSSALANGVKLGTIWFVPDASTLKPHLFLLLAGC
jgi:hypothetical protein